MLHMMLSRAKSGALNPSFHLQLRWIEMAFMAVYTQEHEPTSPTEASQGGVGWEY